MIDGENNNTTNLLENSTDTISPNLTCKNQWGATIKEQQ